MKPIVPCILAFILAGCSTLEKQPVASALVIQSATLYSIEQSSDRAETARRIIAAAEDAKKLMDFEGVTVDELVAKTRARLAQSDRPLSEKAALNALLVVADQYIRDKINAGVINPQDKLTVNSVLDAIINSAKAYA